jgi:penicillin-binding protein 2
MSLNPGWADHPSQRKRFFLFSVAAIGIFLLLLLRLWYLQVIHADRYQVLSERNRTRYIPIAAPRGPIFDRNGELLIDNRPAFGVTVLRQDVENRDQLLDRLAVYLEVSRDVLEVRWKQGRRGPAYRPLLLAENVDRDVVERIQENAIDLPGVLIEVRPLRFYPYGELGAHLFGYLGEITEQELAEDRFGDYRPGDIVGKSGIEQYLEADLRGLDGERRIEVDVRGKELRSLRTLDPAPGNKVYLSLQLSLQKAAETAFGAAAGAVVAMDVKTGEVLAMVSRPAFDPALFARGISGQDWVALLRDFRYPLQNKAIKGQYPPGSTFKIVTALAALRAGVVTPETTVNCTGGLQLGDREFRCWKKAGHGLTDLNKALRESCDVWFYQAGLDLGIDRIAVMSRELGLGQTLGFQPAGEKAGLIPDRAWKRQRFGKAWYNGETANAAIGQGYVSATPLQLAVMTAAVANGGTVLRPQVVKEVVDQEGKVLRTAEPVVLGRADLRAATLQPVRRGLEAVVHDASGTAAAARIEGLRVAGKTGTAQVVRMKEDRVRSEELTYKFRDHALFVAYAPAENPRIAVAVVVEHGSHGGTTAAPIARAVLAENFGLEVTPLPALPPVASGD